METMNVITYESRPQTGSGACSKLRRQGRVPAIFYGPDMKEAIPGVVDAKAIAQITRNPHWETQVLTLALPDGRRETALLREIRRNPLDDALLHVDFYHLVKGRKIRVDIPIQIVGREECAGVKAGGILEHILYDLSAEVLPSAIPEAILVDIRGLGVGKEIKVRDLPLPEGVELLVDPEAAVILVAAPREKAAEEEEEAKEVEVVGKSKKKEEA
jgi:large subunit ribosomal protein L25